jgi:hypothetical protein
LDFFTQIKNTIIKVSLWCYPNDQKKSTKNEKTPVYIRVILNGKKSEGRLYHAEVAEKEKLLWDSGTMQLRGSTHLTNKPINSVQKQFDEFVIMNGKILKN